MRPGVVIRRTQGDTRDARAQRKAMSTGGHLPAKGRGLRRNQLRRHLDQELLISRTLRRYISVL